MRLDALRRAHFPPARNHLPAHLTLFHKLDGTQRDEIVQVLAQAARRAPPPLTFDGVRHLGRGVAFSIASPALVALRADLARRFADQLEAQDRQTFRPHVTVQNKVSPDAARALFDSLSRQPSPPPATGEGLLLWRYLGGPWSMEASIDFQPPGPAEIIA